MERAIKSQTFTKQLKTFPIRSDKAVIGTQWVDKDWRPPASVACWISAPWLAESLQRHWIQPIETKDKTLLIDPFISGNELAKNIDINKLQADYIFLPACPIVQYEILKNYYAVRLSWKNQDHLEPYV